MTTHEKIDALEAMLLNYEPVDCPVTHHFTDGVYTREIFMPKGSFITSMIHKTEHPFFILKGKVRVFNENDGEQILEAPYVGVTKMGTRRVLHILEDCVWCTVHKTNILPLGDSKKEIEDAVDRICDEIIDQRENNLIGGVARNNVITKVITNEN